MSARIIQAEYDQLASVAQRFGAQAEASAAMQQHLLQRMQPLEQGGWQGQGRIAFMSEMSDTVLPAVQRLIAALQNGQRITVQISHIMRAAEEEASRPFRGTSAANLTTSTTMNGALSERGESELTPPPAPAPPDQGASGDGTGEHGVAGQPTDADWETYQTMGLAAIAARLVGYDIMASHMQHYLDNSGSPLEVDVDRMVKDMPEFQKFAQMQYRQEILGEVNKQIAASYHGQPLQFEVSTDWRSDYYPDKKKYADWYYGVGGFSYSHTAVVTVIPDPGSGNPNVTVKYQLHMFDRYNWDAGKSVTLPSSGIGWIDDHTIAGDYIPDTQMGRLHATGIAYEYELFGSSVTHTTTYTYDPLEGVQATHPANTTPGR